MAFGFGFALTAIAKAVGFTPRSLFTSGEQGVWYDPSDFSTMFQDAAGTTPVTGMEQPVGRILDKSGRGNHATQTTATSRPVLSARYNLLTKTEQFDDAAWVAARATITANNTTAPNGTLTADRITETADTGTHRVFRPVSFQPNTTYTASVCFKKGTRRWGWITLQTDSTPATQPTQFFDLDTGLLGSSNTGAGGTQASRVSAAMTSLDNGWYRCSLTVAFGANISSTGFAGIYTGLSNADNVNSYTGSTSDYNWIWGADLRATNMGVGLPAYQRVNTATDYDTAGFPMYLSFDGVDDWLVTPSIDFTATDKITLWAGFRKLAFNSQQLFGVSDVDAVGSKFALFAEVTTSPGSVRFFHTGSENANLSSVGSPGIYPPPMSLTVCATGDISGDRNEIFANGVSVGVNTTDQGSGNHQNLPLFIGSTLGTSRRFNGHLYSLIVRGAQSTAQQIASAEAWVNQRTGAY